MNENWEKHLSSRICNRFFNEAGCLNPKSVLQLNNFSRFLCLSPLIFFTTVERETLKEVKVELRRFYLSSPATHRTGEQKREKK